MSRLSINYIIICVPVMLVLILQSNYRRWLWVSILSLFACCIFTTTFICRRLSWRYNSFISSCLTVFGLSFWMVIKLSLRCPLFSRLPLLLLLSISVHWPTFQIAFRLSVDRRIGFRIILINWLNVNIRHLLCFHLDNGLSEILSLLFFLYLNLSRWLP